MNPNKVTGSVKNPTSLRNRKVFLEELTEMKIVKQKPGISDNLFFALAPLLHVSHTHPHKQVCGSRGSQTAETFI